MTDLARGVLGRLKQHRTLASVAALAVLAGVPTTFAVLHKGFPVTDVDLNAADVWVTNGAKLLGGRLNHQIDELDASVNGSSDDLDVLQNGADYFLTDASKGSVQKIDPAYVSLTDQITVPDDSWLGYGGNTLAILAPDGRLWTIDTSNQLSFNATKDKPAAKLGKNAAAAVDSKGETFATSPSADALYTVSHPGAKTTKTKLAIDGTPQITAVGSTPVVLDDGGKRLRTPDKTLALKGEGLKLQQVSGSSQNVLVAASDRLYRVPLSGGDATAVPSGGRVQATASGVSAPVQLAGCDYGAWATSGRYLYACEGKKPLSQNIGTDVSGDDLRFRVNGNVIALNNLQNGDAWIVSQNMKLVRNWEMLQPNNTQKKQSDKGQEVPVYQSYEQTAAHRTNVNHRPEPEDDTLGVRPGRTTILPVLDNDQDPDGDILTVKSTSAVPPAAGKLDVIDGGRALQFTPAPGASSAAFQYTVTDGRPGGEASANVQVRVHEPAENAAPAVQRTSTVDVEAGQSISYNVLQDWRDPDGDSIFLENASPTSQDDVSFTPDGDITFNNTSNQVGTKTVQFTVSDGTLKAQGTLEVNVKAKGTLPQIAVPDFAQATLGSPTTIDPLTNDTSPSGDQLVLDDATSTDPSLSVRVNQQQGTLSVTGNTAGTYYLTYKLGAGDRKDVDGLIRVDVVEPSDKNAPPLAVNDVAYVHPGQTTSVTPLDNDVSPSGRVLAVQQVTGGADAAAINIQLLDNTLVKITSPGVLEKQVQLSYTVSDGVKSATGTITVVPVAPLVNYQPPVAVADAVNVRAGDITTVDVLDNDYSPDDQPFALDPTLKSTAHAGGTAFVSGSTVRYQAPAKPGQYSVTYTISDEHQQTASADVIFNVIPTGTDQAPDPLTVTGRVFAGSTVPITVPVADTDPDGDSVFFDGVTDKPKLGAISGSNATGFTYRAADSGAGTDQFHYQVEDALGKTAIGTIRIAVIPRPSSLQPPTAVNDKVQVRPGKTGSVQVLANDSDPNGYPLTLDKKIDKVDSQLTDVKVDGSAVLFTAPQTEGVYSLRYSISNGHGGENAAYVQVTVTKNAKPRYPTATDHYIPAQQAKKASVTVDALDGATNPSGPVADLTVQATGDNAKLAEVHKDGSVTVQAQSQRTIIAYQVTDPATKLTGKAFIVIPPRGIKTTPPPNQNQNAVSRKTTDAPRIKPGIGEQVVEMNGSKTFSFGQILDVPSGRPASLAGTPTSDHGRVTGSGTSFTFTPAKDYRGPASVTFNVDDGKEDGSSVDRVTTLVLPVTVGSKDQSDVPPTFTPPKKQIEPGEAATKVDLRAASYHPNPQILASLTYTDLQAMSVNGVTASLNGSTLSVQAPVTAKPGTTAVFRFTVKSDKFSIPGEVDVTVTSSTRPLAQQKNPPQTHSMQRGESYTLKAVTDADWINPFPDTPLTITDAKLASAPDGVTLSHTDSTITVKSSSGKFLGDVNVTYHVQDATKDPARTAQVIGQYKVTIHDVPDAPAAPVVDAGDASASVSFKTSANNGLEIDQYRILADKDVVKDGITAPGKYTVSGLTNGKAYTFTVQAHNADGWSAASAGTTATPYGTPTVPRDLRINATSGEDAPSTFNTSWSAPADTGGGAVRYNWKFDGNEVDGIAGTSRTTGSKGEGSYSFSVQAVSVATGRTSGWVTSKSVKITNPPPTVTLTKGGMTGVINDGNGGYCHSPGTCYYYDVSVSNFPANSTQTIHFYCDGSENGTTRTMSIGGNGSGSYSTSTNPKKWCGYNPASVTVGGVSSGNKDFTANG
ncbi:Ig-like domain-containing protein [Gryllotalpicola koreensis]|uniref:Ig-like domain-containing protein n=1 Tax=Gryllotalpicola koreensis TaxID=993086 RepID=A0ABP8A5M2_9MICO